VAAPPAPAVAPPPARAVAPPPAPRAPDPAAAATAAPESRQAIREAVDRDMEAQRWAEASEGLRRLAELEPDAAARASLLHARALVLKDLLQDKAGAIALLEQALAADPALVPAWDALEPLQRGGGDPVALRRCYARALRALDRGADRALALRLWGGLAEVSWRALGDHATAAAAFEVVRTLDPDDEGPERALAALYLQLGPSASDKAAAAHQSLAARAPDEAGPFRILERLWRADRAPEKAVWASSVLQHLGEATTDTPGPLRLEQAPTLGRKISDPVWECLTHPDEDRVLSALFVVLGPSLVALTAEPPERAVPRGAEAIPTVDPSATRPSRGRDAGAFAAAILAHAAHFLSVPAPVLYLVDAARRPCTVRVRAGWPAVKPILILDRRFAASAPEGEVLFEVARMVALLRPPWILRFGAGPAVLALGLRAASAIAGDEEPTGKQRRKVLRLMRHLEEDRPDLAKAQVAALASELDHRPDEPDLGRWLAAIELSAARAALALTGDLEAAVRRVRAEPPRPGGLAPGERMKDLMAFAVSDDHFAARAALALDALPDTGPPAATLTP
jgi:tetratricopeptide (TPR) repeat protein